MGRAGGASPGPQRCARRAGATPLVLDVEAVTDAVRPRLLDAHPAPRYTTIPSVLPAGRSGRGRDHRGAQRPGRAPGPFRRWGVARSGAGGRGRSRGRDDPPSRGNERASSAGPRGRPTALRAALGPRISRASSPAPSIPGTSFFLKERAGSPTAVAPGFSSGSPPRSSAWSPGSGDLGSRSQRPRGRRRECPAGGTVCAAVVRHFSGRLPGSFSGTCAGFVSPSSRADPQTIEKDGRRSASGDRPVGHVTRPSRWPLIRENDVRGRRGLNVRGRPGARHRPLREGRRRGWRRTLRRPGGARPGQTARLYARGAQRSGARPRRARG